MPAPWWNQQYPPGSPQASMSPQAPNTDMMTANNPALYSPAGEQWASGGAPAMPGGAASGLAPDMWGNIPGGDIMGAAAHALVPEKYQDYLTGAEKAYDAGKAIITGAGYSQLAGNTPYLSMAKGALDIVGTLSGDSIDKIQTGFKDMGKEQGVDVKAAGTPGSMKTYNRVGRRVGVTAANFIPYVGPLVSWALGKMNTSKESGQVQKYLEKMVNENPEALGITKDIKRQIDLTKYNFSDPDAMQQLQDDINKAREGAGRQKARIKGNRAQAADQADAAAGGASADGAGGGDPMAFLSPDAVAPGIQPQQFDPFGGMPQPPPMPYGPFGIQPPGYGMMGR